MSLRWLKVWRTCSTLSHTPSVPCSRRQQASNCSSATTMTAWSDATGQSSLQVEAGRWPVKAERRSWCDSVSSHEVILLKSRISDLPEWCRSESEKQRWGWSSPEESPWCLVSSLRKRQSCVWAEMLSHGRSIKGFNWVGEELHSWQVWRIYSPIWEFNDRGRGLALELISSQSQWAKRLCTVLLISFLMMTGVKLYQHAAKVHFNQVIKDNSTSEVSNCNLNMSHELIHPAFDVTPDALAPQLLTAPIVKVNKNYLTHKLANNTTVCWA